MIGGTRRDLKMPSSPSAMVRVDKATSDLLLAPDWALNMDICDSVNSEPWQAKDVMKAVRKRLQHKNPKVQFLALTLLETLVKNCGENVHHQVIERDILQEMIKIVRKRADLQVRDKILILLDSWQEAFGGPAGKYPQYYLAYAELKGSGVEFPERSLDASPIFTPPITHATTTPRSPQSGNEVPANSALSLDEAMASEMVNLSLSDLDEMGSTVELLNEMLKAVNPKDHGAAEDELIIELVIRCRSNQKKLMHLINSTRDEELLEKGLELNDKLQSLLAKHDAIASGSPLPPDTSDSISRPHTPSAYAPVVANGLNEEEEEDDEDDEFAQLARRNSKFPPVSIEMNSASNSSAVTSTAASSSALSNALTLPDPPPPVRTSLKEEVVINSLSIALASNHSPRHTPRTPLSALNQNWMPVAASHISQPHASPQAYAPYGSFDVPWGQSRPQSPSSLLLQPQPQLQVSDGSSVYPPPPWAAADTLNADHNPFVPTTSHSSSPTTTVAYSPIRASGPWQQFDSTGPQVRKPLSTAGERPRIPNMRQTGPTYVSPNKYFEDLVDWRNADGSLKTANMAPGLSSSYTHGTTDGRK